MSSYTIIEKLHTHPFMKGLSDDYIDLIADCTEEKAFNPNQYLLRYQKPAEEFYLLLSGQIVLLSYMPGNEVAKLETIDGPSIIGWSWLLPPYRWHFDVKATEITQALQVHGMCLRGKMETDKDFGCEMYHRFMKVVVERLQASRLQSMDVYKKPEGSPL